MPDYEEWDEHHLSTCRLIARWKDKVLGWAALSRVSSRGVYEGVAEVSIYIAEEARGAGLDASYSVRWWKPQSRTASGRSRRESLRRTQSASACTSRRDFASWARAKESAAWTDAGVTLC